MGISKTPIGAFLLILSTVSAHYGGLQYIPYVGNVAIGRSISASSTCGDTGPEQYCDPMPSGTCRLCDNSTQWLAHPPSLMIDYGDSVHSSDRTWWQSNTNESQVDVRLDLGNEFFFTHIIISFKSRRPAAMVIYKSSDYGKSFETLQYYSTDCQMDFGPPPYNASCTSIYSHASPGEVVYQTGATINQTQLSDPDYLRSVVITNLKVRLLRFHPLLAAGSSQDPQVNVRQFYAIYNLEVSGWCFCNGLEENCSFTEQEATINGVVPSMCSCTNNTTGRNCQDCLPLYNNSPWRSGFDSTAYTGCPSKCDCNGRADTCQYNATEDQGVCLNCSGNTAGINCQYCSPGYYQANGTCLVCRCNSNGTLPNTVCSRENGTCSCRDNVTGDLCDRCEPGFFNLSSTTPAGCQACSCSPSSTCEEFTGRCSCQPSDTMCCPFDQYHNGTTCVSCDCHVNGSHQVCTENGTCICKPGVGGEKCDECLSGYHSLSSKGCIPCNCNQYGSISSNCSNTTGECDCLDQVIGNQCDRCPVGMLGPVRGGKLTCIPCFCNGYSRGCQSQSGWYWSETVSEAGSFDQWLSVNSHVTLVDNVLMARISGSRLQLNFPLSYLGDKRTSYGLYLSFNASVNCNEDYDMELQLFSMPNRLPLTLSKKLNTSNTNHEIALVEEVFMQRIFHSKPATERSIRKALANILWMRIVLKFRSDVSANDCYMNVTQIKLPYATNNLSNPELIRPLESAPVAAQCTCPHSRTGMNCNRCSQTYTLDPPEWGEFGACVRCLCFGLADTCDPETNECLNCRNNTTGPHCDECAQGYYHNMTTRQCLPCDCPGGPGTRNQFAQSCEHNVSDNTVTCHSCQEGFTGVQCERCNDSYSGNPSFENGTCRLCQCNNNSRNRENRCDSITGQCLCSEGYIGRECEYCEIGYYGNALSHDCQRCGCHVNGSIAGTYCDLTSGQCMCHANVEGRQCDRCSTGYWNINERCLECNCSAVGSVSTEDCNNVTGQCQCREGYDGRSCSLCADGYWRRNGTCIACGCLSSVSPVCDKSTGICSCYPGVTGDKCDRCISRGTTGILPMCELCDECSTRWDRPINNLEISVSHQINRAESLTVTNVSHTEISEGRELIKPLLDLLADIETAINSSTIKTLLVPNVFFTHMNITEVIQVIQNLLERAQRVENLLEGTNSTLILQRSQLLTIQQELLFLCDLLRNLTQETDKITLTDFGVLVSRIQAAVNSSNQSNSTVQNTVLPLLDESQDQLNEFAIKQHQFLNISEEIVDLLTLLRMKLRNYQNLVIRADETLCGADIQGEIDSLQCGCYRSEDRCNSECGGIGCDKCGNDCNSTINEIQRASNLSLEALREAQRLVNLLQNDIETLRQANSTSVSGERRAVIVRDLVEIAQRNVTDVLDSIRSFTVQVNAVISASVLNVSFIEEAVEETLSIQLSKTPEEFLDLLNRINSTIASFPTIEIDRDLRMRAERALNVSLQANATVSIILRKVSELTQSLEELRTRRISVQDRLNQTREDATIVQSNVTKVRELLDSAESSINRLSASLMTLNNSFQQVKDLFNTNRQRLDGIRNLTNETSRRVSQLQQKTAQSQRKLSELKNQTSEKQNRADNDFQETQRLRERMIRLRARAHQQLLRSTSLQNRKTCILLEQERIRDDIKRVSAELRSLHQSIQSSVGRNTICMQRSSLSK